MHLPNFSREVERFVVAGMISAVIAQRCIPTRELSHSRSNLPSTDVEITNIPVEIEPWRFSTADI